MIPEEHEAQLRMALAEGLISRREADAVREEARHRRISPLSVLKERGVITEESLASLQQADDESTITRAQPQGADTLGGPPLTLKDRDKVDPPFPVPGWDRYQGVRFLGQGGMGQVFLAYDPRLRRNVALKFVKGDEPDLVRRFLTEARAQARVEHERVCQVYEVGEVQGRPFIAMQYVDGRPLGQLVDELTVEQKVMVLREAAEGVHAAHRAGLIHRDLKPSNILVERTEDGRLRPYVMDFGLAREWSEVGSTATGAVLGTPHFMSPEQARGEVARLDRRADVYSLGATLYHLLTGQHAIPGTNGLEVLTNIPLVEPSPPRKLDPDMPRDLEAIVLKCLEKERSARYDSARALAEDLGRFLAGDPVQARPTGLWYRLRKKALKHRVAVSVSAVALLAVTLALGWAGYTQRQAARREHLARLFTEKVEHIEALARYSGLSPLHDTREDRQEIRKHMAELEREIHQAGGLAVGPGHYALGRGYLALGEEATAREHLEAAWRAGYREPRVAYALALVLGHLYQDGLLEAERLSNPELREARKQDIQRRYRDPALSWLRQSEGADMHSTEYAAALLAFYEDRLDEALSRLDALKARQPWSFEVPRLRGDILQARAARRWNQGQSTEAQADLDAGRAAYAAAADIGRSVPEVHRALAKLEYTGMVLGVYGSGDVQTSFTRGMEAVGRALQAYPADAASLMLEARFQRRLAERLSLRGEDPQASVEAGLAAANKALQHGYAAWEVHLERGLILHQWAQSRLSRGQDPLPQLRQAEQALQQIAPEKQNQEFHSTRGLLYFTWAGHQNNIGANSAEHWRQAIESFLAAIQLAPRVVGTWINLGMARYRHAEALASNTTPAQREEGLRQAWDALQRAMELNPKHWVPYLYGGLVHAQRAELHPCRDEASRHLDSALDLYRKGLAVSPQSPQLHNGLGGVLLTQAQRAWNRGEDPFPLLAQAQAAYEEAIRLAPQQVYGHDNLGDVHLWRATYQRARREAPEASIRAAIASLEKALALSGDADYQAHLSAGLLLLADWELERGVDPRPSLQRADAALREALRINPRHARAWLHQGTLHGLQARWHTRQGRDGEAEFQAAAQAFEEALTAAPGAPEARLAFGALLHDWAVSKKKAGRAPTPPLERGLGLVEAVLSPCPDSPQALLLRSKLLTVRADTAVRAEEQQAWRIRAREDFSRALATNPHLVSAWKP